MAEPIELKIGQVWLLKGFFPGNNIEIVAVGPEWVSVKGLNSGVHPWRLARASLSGATLVRPKHELWVNVYRGASSAAHVFETKARADYMAWSMVAPNPRIACLKIVFEEGEGL